ncbi:hypothetical protein ACE6H2_018450 [Prunus campanulata]
MHPNNNSDPKQAPQAAAYGGYQQQAAPAAYGGYQQQAAPPHAAAAYGYQQGPPQWTTGLCGCFEDPSNCLMTCCCPCVTFGQNAEIIDKGTTCKSITCHSFTSLVQLQIKNVHELNQSCLCFCGFNLSCSFLCGVFLFVLIPLSIQTERPIFIAGRSMCRLLCPLFASQLCYLSRVPGAQEPWTRPLHRLDRQCSENEPRSRWKPCTSIHHARHVSLDTSRFPCWFFCSSFYDQSGL